ncbi:hypothetical protein J4760_00350 [Salinicoccus sp. ID82-1]|uniref:hypothetical protein n=1 Tax=Salinicoccus sp. ID82-1 TaxID=2820269 RepID=UPI001F1D39F8|nr:hypothetical protein [Salinicoccus sp. ID82-1]MCG1008491.1 hypothetical protein [Salinicoccus sp. ID82-1]
MSRKMKFMMVPLFAIALAACNGETVEVDETEVEEEEAEEEMEETNAGSEED